MSDKKKDNKDRDTQRRNEKRQKEWMRLALYNVGTANRPPQK